MGRNKICIANVMRFMSALFLGWGLSASAAEGGYCDLNLNRSHKTLDFYNPNDHENKKILIVTNHHLTDEMLFLRKGATGSIANDLNYTLDHVPNHPQALDLASRLKLAVINGSKRASEKPIRDVDCYFMRALKTNSGIGETYYLWGLHFQRIGEYSASLEKYEKAQSLGSDGAEFHYNYGLLFYSLGNYELAKKHADKSYSAGFPLEGLRKKLKSQGYYD